MNISDWGWEYAPIDNAIEKQRADLIPARVVEQQRRQYTLRCGPEADVLVASVSGAFRHRAAGPADYPTLGDWVFVEKSSKRIAEVLPRRTAVIRSSAGDESVEQVIAANIDVLFLVFALDNERGFTEGLLERLLVVAETSGARPVVVLNKADTVSPDAGARTSDRASRLARGVNVHLVSARTRENTDALLNEAKPGETIALLGKSGVGKSALVNTLETKNNAHDIGGNTPDVESGASPAPAREGEVRAWSNQGRHTTTDKRLYRLSSGILVADVPGLREVQLWGDDDTLAASFADITGMAGECRFSDCSHSGEPGCRILQALATGELCHDRYSRYLDYCQEIAHLGRRREERRRSGKSSKSGRDKRRR